MSIIKTPHNIITLPVFEVPPRAQDCNLLIQLSQALASMEANQASEVFKSILYFTAQRDVFIQEVDSYYNYLLHNKDFPIFSDREVRRDLKEELLKIKENETNIQNAKFRMLELNYRFMIPKYHKSLISASSAAIYNMLQYKFTTMKSLSSNPEDCVRYFLDELIPISKDMADTKWLQEDLAMKNAVMTGPRSELLPANNIDDVNQAIKKQYTVLGYSTEDYDMLTQINTMPPVDACRIATEFSHTISSMEPDKATYIFKNLLYFAEH